MIFTPLEYVISTTDRPSSGTYRFPSCRREYGLNKPLVSKCASQGIGDVASIGLFFSSNHDKVFMIQQDIEIVLYQKKSRVPSDVYPILRSSVWIALQPCDEFGQTVDDSFLPFPSVFHSGSIRNSDPIGFSLGVIRRRVGHVSVSPLTKRIMARRLGRLMKRAEDLGGRNGENYGIERPEPMSVGREARGIRIVP